MVKMDGRKLNRQAREALRILAVQRVEAGESPEEVIQSLGFHRSCIYVWLAIYREHGLDGLRSKPITGRPPKLTGAQMQKLYRLIVDHDPTQLKFPFALWTLPLIRELIRQEFQVRLSEVSVGRLLKKLGLSPQKPLRRAYEQNTAAVQTWRETVYPALRAQARQENAVIYFGDEAGVRSDFHAGTTWAPKGRTPIVRATGKRFALNLISAVSAQVRRFVEGTQGRLRLYWLPTYSPELNPDELM